MRRANTSQSCATSTSKARSFDLAQSRSRLVISIHHLEACLFHGANFNVRH
jgi:hypothetical protein